MCLIPFVFFVKLLVIVSFSAPSALRSYLGFSLAQRAQLLVLLPLCLLFRMRPGIVRTRPSTGFPSIIVGSGPRHFSPAVHRKEKTFLGVCNAENGLPCRPCEDCGLRPIVSFPAATSPFYFVNRMTRKPIKSECAIFPCVLSFVAGGTPSLFLFRSGDDRNTSPFYYSFETAWGPEPDAILASFQNNAAEARCP